jgi:hypothetical protein
MKLIIVILFLINLNTKTTDIVGTFEYKSASENEIHFIVFEKIDGEIKGKYYGTHYGKHHEILYYRTEIKGLKIFDDGKIEFEIGERELCETTQYIVKSPSTDLRPGVINTILKYHGQIEKGRIKLTCNSNSKDCWDDQLIFNKIE